MGKKARIKKMREQELQKKKRPSLDPELIECYNRAKQIGLRQGREEILAVVFEWLGNLEKVERVGATLAERLRMDFLDMLEKKGAKKRDVHAEKR